MKSRHASKDTKARALMAAGHCLSDDLPPENKSLEDHRKSSKPMSSRLFNYR
ncbi:MAG: hypothetical protein R3D26_03335 [Cyanobacteriota/Melainabacteria group bacterium]